MKSFCIVSRTVFSLGVRAFLLSPSIVAGNSFTLRRTWSLLPCSEKDFYENMNAYQILDVSPRVDLKKIKTAYRKMVYKWHPDKYPEGKRKRESELRLEKIHQAFFNIGNEERRKQYDESKVMVGGSPSQEEEESEAEEMMENMRLGKIMDQFYGPKRALRNLPKQGDDIDVSCTISFQKSILGGVEDITLKRMEACKDCKGIGTAGGDKIRKCRKCMGFGRVTESHRTPYGMISNIAACRACKCSGIENYCPCCEGRKVTSVERVIHLQLPPGVDSGSVLRLKGEGHAGLHDGPMGDMLVNISVTPDLEFRRDGADIHSEAEVNYLDAITGAKVTFNTVEGPVDVRLPKFAQPGQKLRLRGKGCVKLGAKTRGDAFVTLKVVLPEELTEEESQAISQLLELRKNNEGTAT